MKVQLKRKSQNPKTPKPLEVDDWYERIRSYEMQGYEEWKESD